MGARHGNLSINSDNIFPIIKKWLYSDHDIFVRELVSNGCDAITKLKKLEVMGEYTFPENYKNKIQVIVNPEKKTLKFIDTGIGMTADEVEEYITQIAFSGATQFLEKYKDKTNEDQIIGVSGCIPWLTRLLPVCSVVRRQHGQVPRRRSLPDILVWDSILHLW